MVLDPLDLSVEALSAGVGDPKAQVGDDVLEMPLEGARCIRDRWNARMYSPVIPRLINTVADRVTT